MSTIDSEHTRLAFQELLPSLRERSFLLQVQEATGFSVESKEVQARIASAKAAIEARGVTLDVKPGLTDRWFAAPKPGDREDVCAWSASRNCLATVLEDALKSLSDGSGHRIVASLTHTHGMAAAVCVLCGVGEGPRGIGVDCERIGRPVSAALSERIRHPAEALSLKPIAIWAVKEACYKADPSPSDRLSEYRIEHPIHEGSALGLQVVGPGCRFEAGIVPAGGYLLAVAAAL